MLIAFREPAASTLAGVILPSLIDRALQLNLGWRFALPTVPSISAPAG